MSIDTNIVLYEIVATFPPHLVDGRNTISLWGHERRYHPNREEADAALERLAEHDHSKDVSFHVTQRIRDDYSDDTFGLQEWRHALRNAGLSPGRSGIFELG